MTATVLRCHRNSNDIAPRETGGVQHSLFGLYDYLVIMGPSVRVADLIPIYIAAVHCCNESVSNLGAAGLNGQSTDNRRCIADHNRLATDGRTRNLPVMRGRFNGQAIPKGQTF